MTKDELNFLIKKYNLTPNKIRGQNFLVSDDVLADIVKAAELKKSDLVLEVGSGLGALTTELLQSAQQVIAFEVDKNFAPILENLARANSNLEIVWQDILSLEEEFWSEKLEQYKISTYKIVANIPYYLTAKFIRKFLAAKQQPSTITIMIQQEVAERIINHRKHSLLSLSVALYGQAEIVRAVARDNFYPAPAVDSAILHIANIKPWSYGVDETKTWQLIRRGFSAKRKKLVNNLASDKKLSKDVIMSSLVELNLDTNIRAENLSHRQWLELSKKLSSY